jgi:DNA-binding transcriptional regulator YhcF (GntR family)
VTAEGPSFIELSIDTGSRTPASVQIRDRITEAASSGRLAAGARLPTVRALADTLGVAAGTVAKAYRELEETGTIETRGRSGSFIAPRPDGAPAVVVSEAARFAAVCRRAGVGDEQALALIRAALAASR